MHLSRETERKSKRLRNKQKQNIKSTEKQMSLFENWREWTQWNDFGDVLGIDEERRNDSNEMEELAKQRVNQ